MPQTEWIDAEEALRRRLAEVQRAEKIPDAELGRELAKLGFPTLTRDALRAIKRGSRRIALNEALALAWALGIAPVNAFAPFEDPEPTTHGPDGNVLDPPIYGTTVGLRVGDGVDMQPVEARSWIAGRSIRWVDDDRQRRFYLRFVPPPYRAKLARAANAAIRKAAEGGDPDEIKLPVSVWHEIEEREDQDV